MLALLLTNRRDLTTDFLIRELIRRKITACRLNTDVITDFSIAMDPVKQTTAIKGPSFTLNTNDVSVAYFRRPLFSFANDTFGAYQSYVRMEWNVFLGALYGIIGNCWFSHPNNILQAGDKSRQLKLANEIGFRVPETIITNDLTEVQNLQRKFSLIAKPIKQALIEAKNAEAAIFTSSIDKLSEHDRASIGVCPVIFQQHIDKAMDVRVTVVGNRVFPVAIDSQSTEETRVDWRRGSNTNLRHEIMTLPSQLAHYCVQLVQALKLRFGAIDLVKDLNGEFWFLECNPNGQWAWIENRTGLPIAGAIAEEMMKMANPC